MIRAFFALLLIAAVVAASVFFADHPGHVEITWQGWQIETSAGLLAAAMALIAAVLAVLALLIAALRRAPRVLRRRRRERRRRQGEVALTRGLVALAAGNAGEARLAATRAERLLENSPVALLLGAEAAQRQGDNDAARHAYTSLLEAPETEFLGLRGLIGQALHAGDDLTARRLAERAERLRPGADWLAENLLLLQARAGDWPAARATLAGAIRRGTVAGDGAKHRRGVVLYELSLVEERRGELRQAAKLAARAYALAPDLTVAACHRARLLLRLGRRRAAARMIEHAWQRSPQPQLARLYGELDPNAGPLARAAAMQRLAGRNPTAVESHIAVAEAALDAQLWGEARHHLGPAGATGPAPSRRVCLLMARLEEGETGDVRAAREWRDRALSAPPDATYVCSQCGAETLEWQPLCGHCGAFATIGWRIPAAAGRNIVARPGTINTATLLPATVLPSGLAAAAQSDN